MAIRGIRGATTVNENNKEEIISRTRELLETIMEKNAFPVEEIASAIFSVTEDLDAEFPAVAARKIGWIYTPLFCTNEIPVKGSLKKCIRVLIHINTEKNQQEMTHIYLNGAKILRPDMENPTDKYYHSNK